MKYPFTPKRYVHTGKDVDEKYLRKHFDILIKSNLHSYLKNFEKMFGYKHRPLDLNTERYEKNIAFFGCSYTYGFGVENEYTLPSQVQKLFDGKYNCLNFGFCGGNLDIATIIYNKVRRDLNIDLIILQWPYLHRRMYFKDGQYYNIYPYFDTDTEEQRQFKKCFVTITNDEYCTSINLSNLMVLNSHSNVLNLAHPNEWKLLSDTFDYYDIKNIIDFLPPWEKGKYMLDDGHPTELWHKEYAINSLYDKIGNLLND